jgi:hypothetical protein
MNNFFSCGFIAVYSWNLMLAWRTPFSAGVISDALLKHFQAWKESPDTLYKRMLFCMTANNYSYIALCSPKRL